MLDRLSLNDPPSRGTQSTCPRHPSKRAIFLPCKRFVPGYPTSRGEKTAKKKKKKIAVRNYIPTQLLTLTASGDYAQLVECKTIALNTEKRSLAERAIKKKLNLPPKLTFLFSVILFLVLSGRSKDSPLAA